jgi:hypothetical protein
MGLATVEASIRRHPIYPAVCRFAAGCPFRLTSLVSQVFMVCIATLVWLPDVPHRVPGGTRVVKCPFLSLMLVFALHPARCFCTICASPQCGQQSLRPGPMTPAVVSYLMDCLVQE